MAPSSPALAEDARRAEVVAALPLLDWARVWEEEPDSPDWLVPGVVERGANVALVSKAKAGKSLLTLDVCASLAAGRPLLGRPGHDEPQRVLYVDQENRVDQIKQRLDAMGYKPEDLGNLLYLSFPDMGPLDGMHGPDQLVTLVDHYQPALVVLDTVSRMVQGEENSNDTWLRLYQRALVPLKARRIAVLRLDHVGHGDQSRSRGGSAKAGDVDATWTLRPGEPGEIELYCPPGMARSPMPEERYRLRRLEDPLRHVITDGDALTDQAVRIGECVAALDSTGLASSAGRPAALNALKAAGVGFRKEVVETAVKVRKARPS